MAMWFLCRMANTFRSWDRSGLGNSDSAISDSLAQPKPWQSRYTEEHAHEQDEKKSRSRI